VVGLKEPELLIMPGHLEILFLEVGYELEHLGSMILGQLKEDW
jgi:hypothetical protein